MFQILLAEGGHGTCVVTRTTNHAVQQTPASFPLHSERNSPGCTRTQPDPYSCPIHRTPQAPSQRAPTAIPTHAFYGKRATASLVDPTPLAAHRPPPSSAVHLSTASCGGGGHGRLDKEAGRLATFKLRVHRQRSQLAFRRARLCAHACARYPPPSQPFSPCTCLRITACARARVPHHQHPPLLRPLAFCM